MADHGVKPINYSLFPDWKLPEDEFPPLPRKVQRAIMIQSLAGPYSGPTRVVLATIIVDRLMQLQDEIAAAAVGGDQ